MASPKLRLL
jgi:acylphosphatase